MVCIVNYISPYEAQTRDAMGRVQYECSFVSIEVAYLIIEGQALDLGFENLLLVCVNKWFNHWQIFPKIKKL